MEAFFDELAHAGGKDPFELRRTLLANQPRMRAVLELVGQKGDWGKPLPAGRARGIATHFSFDSYVAQVAEVSVDKEGAVRVIESLRCRCGASSTLKCQRPVEGGIIFGLTAHSSARSLLIADAYATQLSRLPNAAHDEALRSRLHRCPYEKPTGVVKQVCAGRACSGERDFAATGTDQEAADSESRFAWLSFEPKDSDAKESG